MYQIHKTPKYINEYLCLLNTGCFKLHKMLIIKIKPRHLLKPPYSCLVRQFYTQVKENSLKFFAKHEYKSESCIRKYMKLDR